MKNKNEKYNKGQLVAGVIFIVSLFLILSCSGRKNKISHRELISADDLVEILTEIYIADGIRYETSINNRTFSADSVATFEYIIKKHGYSADAMERTMKYYFVKKPKKLVKIYDQILSNLTEMETIVQKELPSLSVTRVNLWPGKEYYSLPVMGLTDSIWFDIPVKFTGTYFINFTATLFPDDQSINPRINAWFLKSDSNGTVKKDHFGEINFIKDGRPHLYTFRKYLSEPGYTNLRGCLYYHDNTGDGWSKNGVIENISVNLLQN